MYFFVSSRYLDVSEVLSILIALYLFVVASKGITKSVIQFMDLFEEFRAPSPVKQRRGRRTLQAAVVDDDGASELEQTTTDKSTSKYFPLVKKPNSKFALAAIDAGFEPTESKLPDVSEMPFEIKLPEPTAEQWINNMTDITRFQGYLGNCAPLMKHAREKYGGAGQGGMSTTQVRAWLKKNPEHIPDAFKSIKFHIDHIIPESLNPVANWPSNYFVMPTNVNLHFGKYVNKDKLSYIGRHNFQSASEFCRWCGLKSLAHVEFKQHDPVSDHFMVRRGR